MAPAIVMNKSLLDTDILSEIGKGIDPNVIRNATAYRANFPSYTISTITVMEVVRGLQKKQSLARVQQFVANLVGVEILPFDLPAAELAGCISGDLDRMGQTIGRADPMIAAVAIHHRRELVTGNTGHYQRVQRLGYPLVVLNWR